MGKKTDTHQSDIEWENRVLCSDGNCIGVIGPDGRCKECGLPYEGELPSPGEFDAAGETAATEAEPSPVDTQTPEPPEDESATVSDEEWARRRLCVDGNCIGVIGPDGKCKECGLPYEP